LPLEIIHLNTLPAVTVATLATSDRGFGGYDSRQQQLGVFVALARETAQ